MRYFQCFIIFLLATVSVAAKGIHAEFNNPPKAILIVGPQQDGTSEAISEMNRIADFLKSKGVEVLSFYDKNSDWEKIKKAAEGASILIYAGHGSEKCGLHLSKSVSNEEIVSGLKLKKNAMVLFQSVCYGAGSTAGDNVDIGLKEAEKRVTNYARAFIEKGAGCYFAINSDGGVLEFLTDFYKGKSVQECFENSTEFFYKMEKNQKSLLGDNLNIAIASSDTSGTATRTTYINGVKKVEKVPVVKGYDIAYISSPDFSLKTLLK
jgi:hypothetical protein